MKLALLGSLLLEDTSVFYLHWAGDEADFTAFLHQASYPPVVIEFLYRIVRCTSFDYPPSPKQLVALTVVTG